jgi:HSP20 family molecular chaperone IbpA
VMTKRRRLRGIHDITTTLHKPSKKKDLGVIELDITKSGVGSTRNVTVASPRTWVFSTRPRFVRHQKPVEKSLLVEKVEEPVVNVFEEVKEIVVLAEMPGADSESINCKIKDDILFICAEAKDSWGAKRYEKEVLLPFIVHPATLRTTYENQILEIKLKRKKKKESA